MKHDMQSPMEQLWALLNFSPDQPFTSIGEVREHLAGSRAMLNGTIHNRLMSGIICAQMSGVLADSFGPSSPECVNLAGLSSMIDGSLEMLTWAIERDVLALEVFLDDAAGSDPSLN